MKSSDIYHQIIMSIYTLVCNKLTVIQYVSVENITILLCLICIVQDLKRAEIFKLNNKSGFHLTGEMLVHSTVTGQEITLTGTDIVMCVQFLITTAVYCLSYFVPPEKNVYFIYL